MSAARSLPLALAVLSAACGGAAPPSWTPLARAGAPDETGAAALPVGSLGGEAVRFLSDERGPWIEATLPRAAWSQRESGAWTARLPLAGRGAPAEGAPVELAVPADAASGRPARRYAPTTRAAVSAGSFPPGHFVVSSEGGARGRTSWVILRLGADEEPAERTLVRVFAQAADPSDPGRVAGARLSGEGFALVPGRPVTRAVDVRGSSVLRFATSYEPALPPGRGEAGRARFRVLLDGRALLEHVVGKPQQGEVERHAVALPEGRGELTFEVDGPFAYASVVAPVIGPAEIGTYGARPWGKARPDVVVFLADTFRADNMRVYGSDLPLTPFLDELAGRSLLCREAWSAATYTMPSHAVLFSGLYARQTGATTTLTALPDEVRTIAERFAERGYRTGAVTDAVVVSQQNNLDQGFETFDELHGKLEDTLARARAFLDADDGRPVFLYVQSYRAHSPYVASPAARERLRGLLEVPASFGALSAELVELAHELGLEGDLSNLRKTTKEFHEKVYVERGASAEQVARYERIVADLRALYRAGASDVDDGVRAFYEEIEGRGLLAHGLLVFTSDHGEAFNEHDKVFHGGKVWGETTRVPLFLHGPLAGQGVLEHPVSLIDLPPTLAEVAGLDPEGFLGTSLLRLDRDRPIFAFENQGGDVSTFAIIDAERKVMGYEDPERRARGELFAAFDLGADPHEARDLSGASPAWASDLLQRLTPAVEELSTPRFGAHAAPVDPARMETLRALGYGGEDE